MAAYNISGEGNEKKGNVGVILFTLFTGGKR